MPKHSFAVYGLFVAPRMRPNLRLRVDNIDGQGASLLHLTYGFLRNVQSQPIDDTRHKQYFSIDTLDASGTRICFGADYGKYGVEGEIVNRTNHETTHTFGADESTLTTARNMVIVPPGGHMAILLAERYGGRGAASFFMRQLKSAFRGRFGGDYLLHDENLIDQEAWRDYLANAKLTGIKVVRYDASHDLADRIKPEVVGRLEYEMKPRRGVKSFGQAVKDAFLRKDIQAQQMFGLREALDSDETRLSLDDGHQQRQVVIGKEEPPALVYVLPHEGKDRVKDDVIFGHMDLVVPSLCRQLHLELSPDWREGAWTDEQLAIRMEVIRERQVVRNSISEEASGNAV
ncbi:hypothetical protein ACPFP2_12635 [Micromonospora citrea]|uniref:hypothetical protein n=1 Tax=Micromonospora citrea TaxID=47855 RepID=UPI003C505E17